MTGIVDNTAANRFELEEGGRLAFADYVRRPDSLVITHVEAHPELRGRGTAGRLMEGVAQAAQAEARAIVPLCSYAAAWLRRQGRKG